MFKKLISLIVMTTLLASLVSVGVSADVGDYTMDEWESNDSMALADRIYDDYTVSGDVSGYDLDYFKFVLSSTATIYCTTVGDNSYLYTSLYDADDNILKAVKTSYSNGSYSSYMTATLSSGTYYLCLLSAESYYSSDYVFYFEYDLSYGHTHSYSSSVTPATCTQSGYTTYTCSCGTSYTGNTVAALGHTYKRAGATVAPTCTQSGYTPYVCTTCGYNHNGTVVKALGHTYSNSCDTRCNRCNAKRSISHTYKSTATVKATLTKDGKLKHTCQVCGYVSSQTTVLRRPTSFALSTTAYSYDGKTKTPNVTVKDFAGKTLKKNTDYTVTYASGRKNVGTYKVTVKMKGKYSGTKTLTFKINPPKTEVAKLTTTKTTMTVFVSRKSASAATGYQIQYATNKDFTNAKTKWITKNTLGNATVTGLKSKTTQFVRVRTYKKVGNTTYYSGWSAKAYMKTK